jgi:hypothetical protein
LGPTNETSVSPTELPSAIGECRLFPEYCCATAQRGSTIRYVH